MKSSPDKTNKKQKENFIFEREVLVNIDYDEIQKTSSIDTIRKSNENRTLKRDSMEFSKHESRPDHSDSVDMIINNDGNKILSYGHFSSSIHGSIGSNFTHFDESEDEYEMYDDKFDCANMKVVAKSGMLIFEFPEQESRKPLELYRSSISNASSSSGSISTLCTLTDKDCPSDDEDYNKDVSFQTIAFPLSDTNVRKSKNGSSNLLKSFIQTCTTAFSRKESALDVALLESDTNPRETKLLSNVPIEMSIKSKLEKSGGSISPGKNSKNSTPEKASETNSSQSPSTREIRELNSAKSNNIASDTFTTTTSDTSKSRKSYIDLDDNHQISKKYVGNSSKQLKFPNIIKILLRKEDEIHASPCQCALQLVGLVSASPTYPCTKITATKNTLPQDTHSSALTKAQKNVDSMELVDEHSIPLDCTSNQSRSRGLQGQSTDSNDIYMVRTTSGKYQETKINDFCKRSKLNVLSAEQHQMKLGGPIPDKHICIPSLPKKRSHISLFPKMSSPGMLSTLHEITILRSTLQSDNNLQNNQEYKPWRTITIRCNDHDEMDSLIQALRSTSRPRVIPFSPKPKAKIQRYNDTLKSRKKTKSAKEQNISFPSNKSKKLMSSSSSKQFFHNKDYCELCNQEFTLLHRRHHCRNCQKSCCSTCSSIHPDQNGKHIRYCKSCKRVNLYMHKKPGNRFHNCDHCELCTLHFTILTRRHHCRKCDRSCCSHCSSILMAKGGKVTRYCHLCNNKLRNISIRNAYPSLPGKVHQECNKLGVGVMGKIPHWANFIKTNDSFRPAVARLTIELIEAIALPSLDCYGKIDPYVRATITGYDYDLNWNLVEWFKHKQFSLCSIYCSGTSSPIWLGPGRYGGELLTLPVLRTSGAVLRLEVLHYDVLTNSRGKDAVLGVVEIPLADLPNANLRDSNNMKKKGYKSYDGFVDNWYQLHAPMKSQSKGKQIILDTPVDNPKKTAVTKSNLISDTNGFQSWQEIGQRLLSIFTAPVDWVSSALDLDIPRQPVLNDFHRRSQSPAIHVRLKLNSSEIGDLLSHAWFPLVQKKPDILPYDPQILWSNINKVLKQLDPYLKIIKYCEDIIKWNHPPKKCIVGYLILSVHIIFISYFVKLLHIYLFVFLSLRLNEMAKSSKSSDASCVSMDSTESYNTMQDQNSSDVEDLASTLNTPKKIYEISKNTPKTSKNCNSNNSSRNEEPNSNLNKTVSWIAKILGENRGLEHLQDKLACMLEDLMNLNSLWDGSSIMKTEVTLVCVYLSFVLHFFVSKRLLWIIYIGIFHFSNSPWVVIKYRMIFGYYRGWSQIVKRRALHDLKLKSLS